MSGFRRAATIGACLVVVAVGGPACGLAGWPGDRSSRSARQELIAATRHQPQRSSDGRLAGFAHLAPPSPSRGAARADISPAVWAAVARLQARARETGSPSDQAELGAGWIVAGDFQQAVSALELAAMQRPDNARVQSDLSAAYLGRAEGLGEFEDWSNALAASTRAVHLDGGLREAMFNRAVALERLYLRDQAIEAWTAFLVVEPSGDWADEATRRRAALGVHPASVDDPQDLRERIEDHLLPDWAHAFDASDGPSANRLLDQAMSVARQLVAGGGDRMAYSELMRIERLGQEGRVADLRVLARGFVLYGSARQAYLADRQKDAADLMASAARWLSQVRSPFALWAPVYRSIYLRNDGKLDESLARLSSVPLANVPEDFFHLRGRIEWARGVALNSSGGFHRGREHVAQALSLYQRAGETDNMAATETLVAEADWILGRRASAWEHVLSILRALDRRGHSRRNYHYTIAANLARAADNPEAEAAFDTARIQQADTDRTRAEAYINRAKTDTRLGDRSAARRDLEAAERAVNALSDAALRDRNLADIRIARATLLEHSDPRTAVQEASDALSYVTKATPATRLAPLLVLRARNREATGDLDGARSDLMSALDVFETKRASLTSPGDRIQSFEEERAVYKALVRHDVVRRTDAASALRIAERSHRGAVDPVTAYRDLPDDVALIVYETLDDRIIVWVLTHEGWQWIVRELPARAIEMASARLNRRIADGAGIQQLGEDGTFLFRTLVEPALVHASGKTTLFFVPDGSLSRVPFAALPDRSGSPLVATYTVGMTASLSSLLAATARLRLFSPDGVLALGDGHDVQRSGLPRLPLADDEATEIGALYPRRAVMRAGAASRRALLSSSQPVIHFAGHTVLNREFPLLSSLLLAPENGDEGTLPASEIALHSFERTRVVVLATCEAAAGKAVDGEGLVSVASAFLAAGVPSVVAGLWPVTDADARELFTTFHRELRLRRDAAAALRASQLEILRARGANTPIKAWGGFVAMGGTSTAR